MISDPPADTLPGCLLEQRNGHLQNCLGLIAPLILGVDSSVHPMRTSGHEERELARTLFAAAPDGLNERGSRGRAVSHSGVAEPSDAQH